MTTPGPKTRPLRVWVSEEQVTARALWRTLVLVIFLEVLLFVLLVGLEIQIVRRNAILDRQDDSVAQLHEEVAVLSERVDETRTIVREAAAETPAETDRWLAVSEALRQIGEIRALLCAIDDPVRQQACAQLAGVGAAAP